MMWREFAVKSCLSLTSHWPEYLMEAMELAIFMVSAIFFVILIELPESPVRQLISDALMRRFLIGLAMGLTAITIIYSPFGKRSGAHFNPAVTLTFWRLRKIEPTDAVFYIFAQCIGGFGGVWLAEKMLGQAWLSDVNVNYIITVPGALGVTWAFFAEVVISFVLMLTVLTMSNIHRLNAYTPCIVGILVTLFITVEAPVSGMSMNPARTLGSAIMAGEWQSVWIYFIAPPLGMLLAAECYLAIMGKSSVLCCKLHHENNQRCIFHCRYQTHSSQQPSSTQ